MKWIANMNNALDFIEENLEYDISSEEVAQVAYSSKDHFIRVFYTLTGMTLQDYIRQRRLTLSVKDIMTTDMKIIDIAYKYRYETPEAFTKAFKRLHGVTPSYARKHEVKLNALPPLSFQITVKGEKRMKYQIVEKPGFKLAGIKKRVTTRNGQNNIIIPSFWQEAAESGVCKKLHEQSGELGYIGVCTNFDVDKEEFDYLIAIEGDRVKDIDDYTVVDIPSCTWAIFESIGPMPEAIQNIWKQIYSEWFPATKYEHAGTTELEIYLDGDPDADDYRSEVWIPVISK